MIVNIYGRPILHLLATILAEAFFVFGGVRTTNPLIFYSLNFFLASSNFLNSLRKQKNSTDSSAITVTSSGIKTVICKISVTEIKPVSSQADGFGLKRIPRHWKVRMVDSVSKSRLIWPYWFFMSRKTWLALILALFWLQTVIFLQDSIVIFLSYIWVRWHPIFEYLDGQVSQFSSARELLTVAPWPTLALLYIHQSLCVAVVI